MTTDQLTCYFCGEPVSVEVSQHGALANTVDYFGAAAVQGKDLVPGCETCAGILLTMYRSIEAVTGEAPDLVEIGGQLHIHISGRCFGICNIVGG